MTTYALGPGQWIRFDATQELPADICDKVRLVFARNTLFYVLQMEATMADPSRCWLLHLQTGAIVDFSLKEAFMTHGGHFYSLSVVHHTVVTIEADVPDSLFGAVNIAQRVLFAQSQLAQLLGGEAASITRQPI